MESIYRGKYGHLGTKGRMTDIPSGGMLTPGNFAPKRPGNYGGSGVTRMGRYDRSMPRNLKGSLKTPSSLSSDNTFGKALAQAAKTLLGSLNDPFTSGEPEMWGTLDQAVHPGTGWVRCTNPTDACVPGATLTHWDWFSQGSGPGTCNLGSCPVNQVSVLGDLIPSKAGWPANVNKINIGRLNAVPGRYDHLQQWIRTGPVGSQTPNPYNPTIPLWRRHPHPFMVDDPYPHDQGGTSSGAGASGDWSELPDPGPVEVPGTGAHPLPRVHYPDDSPGPVKLPGTSTIVRPGPGGPRVDPPVDQAHYPVPDSSFKLGIPEWLQWLLKTYHTATEVNDFFESLADAIPGQPCSNMPGFQRAACVLKNWTKIDVRQATANLIWNEIEDRVVATVLGEFGRVTSTGYDDPTITRSTSYIKHVMGNL